MIKVKIDNLDVPSYIKITGHAEYAESGKDIVCSSVSTAFIMTVNQIELFGKIHDINYKLESGDFELEILSQSEEVGKIVLNFVYTIKSLEEQYSKYIKIL